MNAPNTPRAAAIGAIVLTFMLVVLAALAQFPTGSRLGETRPRPTALRPAPTPEPLVPTALPAYRSAPDPTATTLGDPSRTAGSSRPGDGQPFESAAGARARIGVGLAMGGIADYDWGEGLPGWWLNWGVKAEALPSNGPRFAQMVRLFEDGFKPDLATLKRAARSNPGSLWLIGNEPDVAWQDNATPEQYAASYGLLYASIKEADPLAQVAIAGVSQPTPLRMAYLDRVLDAYRAAFGAEMPVDIWNVHAFILREEQGSWGAGIPPGMTEGSGRLYEIADHADMRIFRQQIADFRRWMAERGFREKPLIVSEYGILMPESYGFPPDLVAGFLADTLDFFLTARDPEVGYRPDDGRLVQAACWYSAADTVYPTPNLFDPHTKAVTPVGEMFKAYVAGLR